MQSQIVASLVVLAALFAGEASQAGDSPLPPRAASKTAPKAAPKTAPAPTPPAPDQSAAPAPDKPKDKADQLFEEATVAFDDGKLDEARTKLTAAWQLKETYDIAGNLGIIELKLGHARDAAEHLAYALRNIPPTEDDAARAGLQQKFNEARGLIAALLIRVNVEHAEVQIDGKTIGRSPFQHEIYVNPGTFTVKGLHDGFAAAKQTVIAKREPVAQEVVLDLTPLAETTAVVPRGYVPAIALGGGAVVGFAVGIGLLVAGGGKRSTAEDLYAQIEGMKNNCVAGKRTYDPLCPQLKDTASSSDTLHNAGVGFMIVGALAAAGAGAYMLWPMLRPKPKTSAGITVQAIPVSLREGGGVLVTGTF